MYPPQIFDKYVTKYCKKAAMIQVDGLVECRTAIHEQALSSTN